MKKSEDARSGLLLAGSSGSPTIKGEKKMERERERELLCRVVAESSDLEMDGIGWSKLKCKVSCFVNEKNG
jgi:hypothetical protein